MKRLCKTLARPFLWLADCLFWLAFPILARDEIEYEEAQDAADRAEQIARAVRHPYAHRDLPFRSYP